MALTRKKKASLNILSSFVLELISILNSVILPKFIIQTYGSSYNGIVASVTQFFNLISLLTIGVTASTRVALYHTLADQDIQATSRIVRAMERYMRKIGILLAVYIVGLSFIYPLIIGTEFLFWDVTFLILIVGISAFSEYYFGITYRTLLLADQRVYISNIFTSLSTALNLIFSVILIHLGFSIQIVKLSSGIIFMLKPFLQGIYVSKKYKLDKHCSPDLSALKNRRDAMTHSLSNIIHNNTDLVVLSLFTDVKTVSVYTVYNLVIGGLSKLQNMFTFGTEPIFGNMWAKGELESIRKSLSVYEFFVSLFSSIVYSVTFVMILPFVALYTLNVTDINYIRPIYSVVIILAFLFHTIRMPYLTLIQGIGHYRETKFSALLEAGINLTLSILLVIAIPAREYKMIGVAVGTLVANLYQTIVFYFYIDKHVLKRGKKVFVLRILWTFLNLILVCVPSRLFVSSIQIDSWFQWIVYSIGVTVFCLIIVGLSSIIFYRSDLIKFYHVLFSMIKKRVKQ